MESESDAGGGPGREVEGGGGAARGERSTRGDPAAARWVRGRVREVGARPGRTPAGAWGRIVGIDGRAECSHPSLATRNTLTRGPPGSPALGRRPVPPRHRARHGARAGGRWPVRRRRAARSVRVGRRAARRGRPLDHTGGAFWVGGAAAKAAGAHCAARARRPQILAAGRRRRPRPPRPCSRLARLLHPTDCRWSPRHPPPAGHGSRAPRAQLPRPADPHPFVGRVRPPRWPQRAPACVSRQGRERRARAAAAARPRGCR